ncbi:uncharacterized protein TRIADDRAFT_60536 [Trichoplax adhaerens]|uniref:Uncharacterized protein n=1 Tax=Trichoplax adhaerens TaxID=10228 RepID=B3S8G9_TRIAD|nr:predicted protein [Trichoplax adhaerens]EDV20950.1 predicted protein [Trichoplax adhaerens]|eukprot:XP_002116594.1 predicted protein [Trichoplax adhaerens]
MDLSYEGNFVDKPAVLYDDQDKPFQTFCRKLGNSILTMFESYSKNNSLHSSIAHSYYVDSPTNTGILSPGVAFPFDLFRLSKSQMVSITSKGRFMCTQCITVTTSGQNKYSILGNEVLKLKSTPSIAKSLFETPSLNDGMDNCVPVFFMSALNRPVANRKMPAYSRQDIHFHLSMDEAASRCDKVSFGQMSNKDEADKCGVADSPAGAPITYNLFGNYNKCTRQFSCSKNENSITAWWVEEEIAP